ncbi:hypothetical protein ACTFRI_28275, partial [Bacillus cereus group sp. MYBK194-1]
GLFDMPTFIKSIKDNKKLYKKNTFCLKISLKLMDVGYSHIAIKLSLRKVNFKRDCFFFLKNKCR